MVIRDADCKANFSFKIFPFTLLYNAICLIDTVYSDLGG